MVQSVDFFESIINSVTEHIVIIDGGGSIAFVNSAWVEFGIANDSRHRDPESWKGSNYLDVCDASAVSGEDNGAVVAAGLRRIVSGEIPVFYHEYPCHSDTEKRWFMMRITKLQSSGPVRFIVSHQNITERKLAEERVRALSLLDGLTGIANRRYFNEFLEAEWRRGLRAKRPVSLALLDVDHFKLYNDHYGHAGGDDCLKQVGSAIGAIGKRPGDLGARYGGEEFALVMGNTGSAAAYRIACDLCRSISEIAIPHEASPVTSVVTASVGVATLIPENEMTAGTLIEAADMGLYDAKRSGRNRVGTAH